MFRLFRSFAFWFTALSVLLCLFHYAGYDHDNIVFMIFSPVTWVLPLFVNLNLVNTFLLYVLTVAVWFGSGLAIDRYISKYGKKRAGKARIR